MKEFKTGDQVEVKLCREWLRATYIANRPDNGAHIISLNHRENELTYNGTGDIHCCHINHNDNIRPVAQCCDHTRRCYRCHCCPKY